MQKISFCERYMLTTAVLNRTKELTRRLEKALERLVSEYEMRYEEPLRVVEQRWDKNKNRLLIYAHTGIADTDREHVLTLNTRYKLGEVVAVAQAYKDIEEYNPESYEDVMLDQGTICESSHPYSHLMRSGGWDNKMFVRPDLMPHQIQITGVRIERLQDISDADCLNEGVVKFDCGFFVLGLYRIPSREVLYSFKTPREAFAALIDRPGVGRKGLWESNPFVVVYEFKLEK